MANSPESIRSAIMSSDDEIVSLLSEMIEVPSPTGQEGEMAVWLKTWLESNNFDVESIEIDRDEMLKECSGAFFPMQFPYEGRPNIVGTLKGKGEGPSLMINFHLDVVDASAGDWSVDPWKGTLKGDTLIGRGACDMKGGAAAALYAIKTIIDSGISLNGDLVVAGVIEEEGPGNGTIAVQAAGVKADACIIPEPTELSLAVGVTGGIYGFVDIEGKTSHSTTPWNGVNAVEKAFHVQKGIEEWKRKRGELELSPLFADEPDVITASHIVNIIRTDSGLVGKIPASAKVMVRSTVLPGEDPRQMIEEFEKTILAETVKDPWLAEHPPTFVWIRMDGRNYPAELSEDHPLCCGMKQSFRKVTGKDPKLTALVSPADMQQLMNFDPKTPTLMFGPGSLLQAHTDDEFVPVQDLVQVSAVIADFIMEWCGIS